MRALTGRITNHRGRIRRRVLPAIGLMIGLMAACSNHALADVMPPPIPANVQALSRQLRVDLVWDADAEPLAYEIQRAQTPDGAYSPLPVALTNVDVNAGSDFLGRAGGEYFYQVRSVRPAAPGRPAAVSPWSAPCHAHPLALDAGQLIGETQEAGFRYFYNYGHPTSGLARMGTHFTPNVCSASGTGFGMFNVVVGIERGFITRQQGVDRARRTLRFLAAKTTRYHGAFPHMLDGITGQTIPFTDRDDGADIVETSFLMAGVLLWREYFSGNNSQEAEIRQLANQLWRDVDWHWFVGEEGGVSFLRWHWSPKHGWDKDDRVIGFNEAQLAYVLALASPTHPIPAQAYWQGWEPDYYGKSRTRFGVWLQLGQNDLGPPLFWIQYSYLGLDPRQISYRGRTYMKEFQDICRVAMLYADSRSNEFKGYGRLWGWTAGDGPNGYQVHAPGTNDDGTINPSAALSAMPYAPEGSRAFLLALYSEHGRELWGPFGFYDGFNLSRNWFDRDYLASEIGTIAPMIENQRSGLCWKTFMRAPELAAALKVLASPPYAAKPH